MMDISSLVRQKKVYHRWSKINPWNINYQINHQNLHFISFIKYYLKNHFSFKSSDSHVTEKSFT